MKIGKPFISFIREKKSAMSGCERLIRRSGSVKNFGRTSNTSDEYGKIAALLSTEDWICSRSDPLITFPKPGPLFGPLFILVKIGRAAKITGDPLFEKTP